MKKDLIFALSLSVFGATQVFSQPVNPWTPPEYFPSKAVLIEWDFNTYTWSLYAELIDQCRRAAEVILVVRNEAEENEMRALLNTAGVPTDHISFVHTPCERMWIRDHGPLAVQTDFGEAYIDFDDLANSGFDETLPTDLANVWALESYALPYTYCGGNFMVDRYNTLFTTHRLYTNNPIVAPDEIDQALVDYMGINRVVTFKPQHDDYWGHIDMQIKLLDDTTFVISTVTPDSGPNYDSLEANYQKLLTLVNPYGRPYRIEKIPMADNWKTYANALILNNMTIVPFYDHPYDSIAYHTYSQLMPNHTVVGVNCNKIIGWEGALHCITMQLFDDAATGVEQIKTRPETALHLSPNPAQSGKSLQIRLPDASTDEALIRLYASDGRLVRQYRRQPMSDGACTLLLDVPAGVYSVTVATPDAVRAGVVVVR